MQTENNLLLEINHYADIDYSAESSFRYKYYLVVAPHQIISIIADEQLNRVVSFKTFTNNTVSFLEMDYDDLKLLTDINNEFLPTYKSKKVIVADSASILVPESLNNLLELEAYYSINKKIKQNSQVLANKLDFKHTVNVFNIRNEILKFIRFNMPTADIIHQSLLFVKACSCLENAKNENSIFMNINFDSIDLLQFKKGEINFYNNFKFDSHTDIVYYILAVVEQLGISDDWELTIYGNIDSQDSLFALLGKYCKNMRLGKRNTQFTYPLAFDNVPEHFYFTALNVLLCE